MSIRAHFPLLESKIYLPSCSHGVQSIEVREAFPCTLDHWNERGVEWQGWIDRYEGARDAGFRIATSCEEGAQGDPIAVQASDENAIVEALAGDGIVTSFRDGKRPFPRTSTTTWTTSNGWSRA